VLLDAYRLLWRLQAGGRLLTDAVLDMGSLGEGGRAFILRETDAEDVEALMRTLHAAVVAAAAMIAGLMNEGRNGETGDAAE
jgi:[glutamine synthetase] adenylyltransferase / [glutamine synthetase]-adenylyl-L-tyrosine phosphorylase